MILLMIADRLCLMRMGKQMQEDDRIRLATEASYLYAPLAHRLGLYTIKSELEDLSLKYTDRKQYDFIKRKLNETKRSRDAYIAEFIAPIKRKLAAAGFKFDIKGRTKSIHSINNKLKKQQVEFRGYLRSFRYPDRIGYAAGEGTLGMLASLLHRHRYVPAQPEAYEGLDLYSEDQRLRACTSR